MGEKRGVSKPSTFTIKENGEYDTDTLNSHFKALWGLLFP